ncbi:tyrosine-protein kinase-like otk isoform X2 [Mya arenaria]|uniref:tyrosine-protein kinase-like otk isoform X2 n=1 Tax=Mya arenaria TaxID=6604 RepID=UPI0022E89EAC|nr:tyrosine-protein kinase-like otk isoform X2 [Mya arenaria]
MRSPELLDYVTRTCLLALQLASLLASGLGFRLNSRDHAPRPYFTRDETNVTFIVGDTAKLMCGVMDIGTKLVTWKRDTSLEPLTIGDTTFAQRTDYEVHHIDPYWNLLIKNVQLKHAGTYECQISTKDKMKRTVHLNVIDDHKRRKPAINITGQQHVDKGQSIVLSCNATDTAAPPDHVDWFKDGNALHSNEANGVIITKKFSVTSRTISSILEIKNAKMSDKGTYTCRTSDKQVHSLNVNILNEKPINKRVTDDEEKLQPSRMEPATGSASVSYSNTHLILLVTFLVTWFNTSSRDKR